MLSNSDANNDFIKYYEVKDGKIIIHYKNSKEIREYSKNLETFILEVMKLQINNSIYRCENDINDYSYISFGVAGLVDTALAVIFKLLNFKSDVLIYVSGSMYAMAFMRYKEHKHIKKLYDDYKKNLLFIENQYLINENLKQFLISEGLVDENATFAIPLYEVYATINDAHFLSEDEVQDLIDGNINGEMILRLYKPSI